MSFLKLKYFGVLVCTAVVAGIFFYGVGCQNAPSNGDGDTPATEKIPGVQRQALLQAFSGETACADLEKYLEDTAVKQMRTQLEANRDEVPTWGWWGGGVRGGDAVEDSANKASDGDGATAGGAGTNSDGAAPSQSAPGDYTTTNTQVAGVDEADFVKNDGTRIFMVSGGKLHALHSWPAEDMEVQGTLDIEGYPRELFLDGKDKAIIFSTVYRRYALSHARGDACDELSCGYYSANTVKVTVVNVSDMASMQVLRETYLPGRYNSARKIGTTVRLVLSDEFRFPDGFDWAPEWPRGIENSVSSLKTREALKKILREAYDELISKNETLIRAQTLAQWLPAAKVKVNGETTEVPHDCASVARVNAPTRLGMLSIVTLNSGDNSVHRATILSESGEVYASARNLYVATRHWWWWPRLGQMDTTYIHKFGINMPDKAVYAASGTVDGHIVDQFSMDEAESGHFRIVTTIQKRIPDTENPDNWWGTTERWSRLTVLGQKDLALEITAQSEDLAKGERVTSSRIVGDRGFVVTFRQVDPLFTFDLSDPTKVVKKGELKIPGFSTYIHPLGPNHLLTIGTYVPAPANGDGDGDGDAEDKDDGEGEDKDDDDGTSSGSGQSGESTSTTPSERALQLAIFDVTDLTKPQQTHRQLVGSSRGWSEAQREHRAFNYFAEKKLLAIPFADWNYGGSDGEYWTRFVSELKVYHVEPTAGFTARGALSMKDVYEAQGHSNWTFYWRPFVRRSILADDYVYAISDAAVRVANIQDLSKPLATARLQRYAEKDGDKPDSKPAPDSPSEEK